MFGIVGIIVILSLLNLFRGEEPKDVPTISSVVWTKHLKNPVLPAGPDGAWNYHKSDPTVLKDGNVYKMWHNTGSPQAERTVVAYAESNDGINWKLNAEPVLTQGPKGSWDSEDIETPTVIKDDNAPPEEKYKMWYAAFDDNKDTYRIGYATSPDGINWTKHKGNPVINVGNIETHEWDAASVADPMVIKEDGVYRMWYSGAGDVPEEKTWHIWVGYATSEDGINWTKYKDNPVLDVGKADSFEDRGVGQPSVVFNGSEYEMWYSGWDDIDKAWSSQIGYATSSDGIHWIKSSDNPVVRKGEKGEWDSQQIVAPTVILDGEGYKMWYTGMKVSKILGIIVDMHIGIGCAESNKSKQ